MNRILSIGRYELIWYRTKTFFHVAVARKQKRMDFTDLLAIAFCGYGLSFGVWAR